MALHVIDHPAAAHFLTVLRNRETSPEEFRRMARALTTYVVIEATRDLPLREARVETPLEWTTGRALAEPLVLVPILRAGLGMMQPVLDILPEVAVGFVGLERDERTAEARAYYGKLPPLAGRRVLLVDPMLATGGSAAFAIRFIKERGGRDIVFACIVAAPEGVQRIADEHPEVRIVTAALDRELNSRKFICPGLGDFGDRLFFT